MNINMDTIILGLIGNPLGHSLSPLMHNMTLDKLGVNGIYVPFEVSPGKLEGAIAAIRSLDIRGVNVTIPFKEEVIKYLDDLSEEAAACGAVNVISNVAGRLVGYNTDGKGFVAALQEEQIDVKGRAVFIGAGGAARSVAYELARAGISRLDFLDLSIARAEGLANFITKSTSCCSSAQIMNENEYYILSEKADIIINCSPVGMYPNCEQSPVAEFKQIPARAVLCDLIYNPWQTKFLRLGQEHGLKTIGGCSMFVHQGAQTLEILMGLKPPLSFMKEVVRDQLEKRAGANPD
ncbi:MAG: shikimate dehydrogenase [Syntrophomonas sp.]